MEVQWEAVIWGPFLIFSGGALLSIVGASLLRSEGRPYRPILAVIIVGMILISGLAIIPAVGPWNIKAEGTIDRVETYTYYSVRPHGSSRARTQLVIFFQDGRAYDLSNVTNVPFPKGTKVRILEKNDHYKIEKAP